MSTKIENILSRDERTFLFNVIQNACFMNKMFLEKNSIMFNNSFESNIKSRLLTHMINIEFLNKDFMKNCPFDMTTETKGSTRIWKLSKENLILTIKQVKSKKDIVKIKSKYMKEYSKGNDILDNQISFFEKEFTKKPLYGIIAFSELDINTQKPKLANIVFPNQEFKIFYEDIDLLPNLRIIKSWEDIVDERTDIVTLKSLKKDFKKEVK